MTLRPARRRKTAEPSTRGESWAIVDLTSARIDKETTWGAGAALSIAQHVAIGSAEPVILSIERRNLFGPSTELYRIVRDEDGIVTTYIVSLED